MPLIPQWYDETKTIYLFHYTASLKSWDEYWRALETGLSQINTVTHPVIVLFDPYNYAIPPGNPLTHLRKAVSIKPPHVVAVVSISTNRFLNTAVDWFKKVGFYPWLYNVETQVEADELIQRIQAQYPELKELVS